MPTLIIRLAGKGHPCPNGGINDDAAECGCEAFDPGVIDKLKQDIAQNGGPGSALMMCEKCLAPSMVKDIEDVPAIKAKLNHHPNLKYRNASCWPPPLYSGFGPSPQAVVSPGEELVLEQVQYLPAGKIIQAEHLMLTTSYSGKTFKALVASSNRDPTTLRRLLAILQANYGKTLTDIGDLVVEF